jgi:sugar/nucleoside kinase (ribokinase family)
LNQAKTHNTELNVFATFEPKIPEAYADSQFLFLANIDPVLQRCVREAMPDVKLVAGDTMNYWIKDHRAALLEVLKGLDALLINDTEARMLADNGNLVQAAKAIHALGPKTLIVKHGEYGATLFQSAATGRESIFRVPAVPLAEVIDPTGAGDSFAGGFFGYLAAQPEINTAAYRNAMFYGSVMGSYACERFGTERHQQLTRADIDARFEHLREISHLG